MIMTLIYFILILGITVMIHEFGHYMWAKKMGLYVYEFSIGMGPRLFKWNRTNDETEYSIRLLPIGGYVSLAGEIADDNIPKGMRLQDKNFFEKFIITVAGVVNNFILAFILLFIIGLFTGYTNTKPIIEEVSKDSSAYNVGIQKNDQIVKINGKNTNNIDKLLLELQTIENDNIKLGVLRDSKYYEYDMSLDREDVDGKVTYHIGFTLNSDNTKGILAAFKYATYKFASLVEQMVFIIIYLFSGRLSLNNLSGPVGIYVLVGTVSKEGLLNIIYLLAYISLNVGIINLLPFPAFDGGRLFIYIIEKLIGHKVSQKLENGINTVGFALLMILMVYVTFNDIINLF